MPFCSIEQIEHIAFWDEPLARCNIFYQFLYKDYECLFIKIGTKILGYFLFIYWNNNMYVIGISINEFWIQNVLCDIELSTIS